MSICDVKIAHDISSNCTNPLFAGKMRKAYIINYEDRATYTATDNVVSALTLAAGAKAYAVEVNTKNPYNGTNTAMNEGDMLNDFTHNLTFHVPNDGATFRKNIVDKLANGKFIVIVENKWTGTSGDNQFQIYGWDKGLEAGGGDFTEDAENGGWTFTLQEVNVARSGWYFWDTDEATSRAALEALL